MFVYLLLSFNSFCIYLGWALYVFYKGFLQVCSFSFSSTEHKFLILMKSSLSIISSLVLYLISYHHIQSHLDFLLLSSRSFILLQFTFKPMIHFELNFVKGVRSVFRFFFLFFAYRCSFFFSTICWKEQLSTIALSFLLCQMPLDYIYVALFLASYSIPLMYLSFLSPISYCIDYCKSESVSHSVVSNSLWPHEL